MTKRPFSLYGFAKQLLDEKKRQEVAAQILPADGEDETFFYFEVHRAVAFGIEMPCAVPIIVYRRKEMNKRLKNQRITALRSLEDAYATLRGVEHHLTDKEANLLIDIAQTIETLEETLECKESDQ